MMAKCCDAIILAGDMFDSPSISLSLLLKYIKLFNEFQIPIYTVYGQHDMRYRSREDTPLYFLSQLGIITILENRKKKILRDFEVVGCSFGEEIPGVDKCDMLVIHRMVIKDKLWFDQKDYVEANKHNEWANGFDFVLSGDNHKTFSEGIVFNPGSLMRSKSDQRDHVPVYGIYDIVGKKLEVKEIPVQPIENIMYDKEISDIDPEVRFKDLISNLSDGVDKSIKIDFIQFLRDNIIMLDKGIINFIEEVISNANRG
jgi:DNA repair exonuclease SbcCD nuclease subunit